MKKIIGFIAVLLLPTIMFYVAGCGVIDGVRVTTDYGIVDVKEDGKVSAQIIIDGVEFYIEDNELIEINAAGLVENGVELGDATVTLIPKE